MTASLLQDDAYYPEILDSERVFHGRVWDVRSDRVKYNDVVLQRDYVDHTGAVAIVALDEQDRLLVIKQYRHPVRHRCWEIPAGLLDLDGEPPWVAAQRELSEEADIKADTWNVLAEFYTSPGGSNEALRVYLARGIHSTGKEFTRSAEEADIEVRWVALDEVVDAVLARRVQNPSLNVGVLAAYTARARGWASLAPADIPWPRHPKLGRPAS